MHFLIDVALPVLGALERGPPRDVEHNHRRNGGLEVHPQHPPVALLPRNVPQLQPHRRLLVELEHFERKVHADRGAQVLELVANVAIDDRGLACAFFAYQNHLEEEL
eukprot:Amastigsp_a508518_472.p6 type:complete len:107 gc:universal Amastigsp_a508518_472:439-119(-)